MEIPPVFDQPALEKMERIPCSTITKRERENLTVESSVWGQCPGPCKKLFKSTIGLMGLLSCRPAGGWKNFSETH